MFHCLSKPWNKPSSALSTLKLEQPLRRRYSERHLRKNTEFCAYNYLNFWYFFQCLSLFNLPIKLFVCSNQEMCLNEWFLMWISCGLKVCVLHKTFSLNFNSTLFGIKQTKKYTIKLKRTCIWSLLVVPIMLSSPLWLFELQVLKNDQEWILS